VIIARNRLRDGPLWVKVLAVVVLLLAMLAVVLALFPWDTLRGPLNRYVSEKTEGRQDVGQRAEIWNRTRRAAAVSRFSRPFRIVGRG